MFKKDYIVSFSIIWGKANDVASSSSSPISSFFLPLSTSPPLSPSSCPPPSPSPISCIPSSSSSFSYIFPSPAFPTPSSFFLPLLLLPSPPPPPFPPRPLPPRRLPLVASLLLPSLLLPSLLLPSLLLPSLFVPSLLLASLLLPSSPPPLLPLFLCLQLTCVPRLSPCPKHFSRWNLAWKCLHDTTLTISSCRHDLHSQQDEEGSPDGKTKQNSINFISGRNIIQKLISNPWGKHKANQYHDGDFVYLIKLIDVRKNTNEHRILYKRTWDFI